jgi:integrase
LLTDRFVKALKPRPKRYYVRDKKVTGLEVAVSPDGSMRWRLRYRFNGKWRGPKLGDLPRLSLSMARERANEQLRKIDGGIDPKAERLAERRKIEQANRNSIEALCESYIENHAKKTKRTWRDDQSKINREILRVWKGRPVSSITRRDCRELLQAIAGRGAAIYANRVAALLSRLFRFAVDEEIIEVNPAAHLPKEGVEVGSRPEGERESKAYDENEIRAIWKAAEDLSPALRAIYRLGLLTGQRSAEVSDLEWREIDGSWWTIPGRRAKNKKSHRVYLTQTALDLLRDVPRVDDDPHVFRGWRGKRQLAAANKIVFGGVRRREKPRHALRDTVITGLAKVGVTAENIAKVVSHSYGPKVTAGYNAYNYDEEKKTALEAWGRHLDALLTGHTSARVVPFRQ